jgi:hypothetical protein
VSTRSHQERKNQLAAKKTTESSPNDFERSWRIHRRLVRLGQVFMIVGAVVAATHWLAHIEAFGPGQPPGWLDLVAGYPTGALLLVAGAILAGRKRPSKQVR